MKTFKFYLFLAVSTIIFSQPLMAITRVSTTLDGTTQIVNKSKSSQEASKELKKQFRQEKKMAKFERLLSKFGMDFSDPVQKWLWLAIIAWGVAIILYILGVFVPFVWYIAYLASLAGTVFFILWLVKMLGA